MSAADNAKRILDDEFFKQEMRKLEGEQFDIIANSGAYDVDERENAYRMLKAVQAVQSHFESLVISKKINAKRFKIL